MIDEVISNLEEEAAETIASLQHDLGRIRAGRANPSLLDGVKVDYYGSDTPLKQLATVNAPEPRLLIVQPFDQSSLGNVERAIIGANLGLTPNNDGKIIRLPIPELTEERRRELVKQARREAESHRISARSHRREANDMLKQLVADKDIGEDDSRGAQERVQKITDGCVTKIDEITKAKEEEIMAV